MNRLCRAWKTSFLEVKFDLGNHYLKCFRTSLAVQLFRLHASNAGGVGSIPGQGTKIPHAAKPKNK